jgi:hypothetical protein
VCRFPSLEGLGVGKMRSREPEKKGLRDLETKRLRDRRLRKGRWGDGEIWETKRLRETNKQPTTK